MFRMFRNIGFFRRRNLTNAEMDTYEKAMRNADPRPGYNTRQSVRDTDPVGRIPRPPVQQVAQTPVAQPTVPQAPRVAQGTTTTNTASDNPKTDTPTPGNS